MNVLTELSMPLYPREYKRLVTGEDCQVVAKQAIKQLLERTMDEALRRKIGEHLQQRGAGSDRRNGYYERDLLTRVDQPDPGPPGPGDVDR
jgi:transposase-like protein